MSRQEQQQRKMIGIIGTGIVVVISGLLLATSLFSSADARPTSSQALFPGALSRPQQTIAGASARPTPPPLPTIVAPTPSAPVPNASRVLSGSSALQRGNDPSTTNLISASSDDLAARLANDLRCLQHGAQHVAALDVRAAELAKDDTTPLPQSGVIHFEDTQGHRFLLGFDMVASLQIEHARCGETLIFGVPPLDWLPEGSHFGIGVSEKVAGLIIVVVTGS